MTRVTSSKVFPREKGLHANKLTEPETIMILPDTGRSAEQNRGKERQIGSCDPRRPLLAQSVSDHALGMDAILFYHTPLATLIYEAIWT